MNIGRHFTLEELTHSNTAKAEGIPNAPGPAEIEALRALCAGVLDPLREALAKPITINCAYRGPALNKRVGGVANSQHLTGQAADLQSPGATVLALFKLVITQGLPYDQVIYEARSATSKWLHVSHVAPAVGTNRGEIRVARFGPDGKPQSYPLISKAEALAMAEPASRSRSAALTYEEGADEPAMRPSRSSAPRKAAVKVAKVAAPAAKKAAPAKAGVHKAAAKQSTAKTPAAKKPVAKKAAATKTAAAKSVGKKPAAGKPAAKKPAAKKSAPAKPARKRAAPA